MKRKLFSAILFGACLVASTSGLTSCKDYDDDISNLQSQIDKLATKEELATKASELSTAISNAQSAADAAKKTAEDAAAAAKAAATKDDVEAAKKAAIEAGQAAADKAQKAADAAQAAADKNAEDLKKAAEGATKAVEEIQTAMEGLATTEAVTAAVKEVADKYDAQAKDLEALSGRLDKVEAKLGLGEGGEDIDLTEIQAELDAIEDALDLLVGSYSTMITSISVFKAGDDYAGTVATNKLTFKEVTEKKNVFPAKDNITDKKYTFTDGWKLEDESSLVVRVTPATAKLEAANVRLINSQGKDLSDLMTCTKVEPYTKLLGTTRATTYPTGLYTVTYKLNAGWTANAFKAAQKATIDRVEQSILYAVAVTNSDSLVNEDRLVASEWNVVLATNPATTPTKLTVDGTNIAEIRNRYNTPASEKELSWLGASFAAIPAGTVNFGSTQVAIVNSPTPNYADNIDDRRTEDILKVQENKDITIKFDQEIKGFYVDLDYRFRERNSNPSEIVAWNSYTYDKVGKYDVNGNCIQKATMIDGNEGKIKISNVGDGKYDVIGFRIYAVNLDGTLLDPDGIAFYVGVGDDVAKSDLAGTIDLQDDNNIVWIPADGVFVNGDTYPTWQPDNNNKKYGLDASATANQTSPALTVEYYKADRSTAVSSPNTNASDIKWIKVTMASPAQYIDGETYKQSLTITKTEGNVAYDQKKITLSITKKMPATFPTSFDFLAGQPNVNGKFNAYMVPGTSNPASLTAAYALRGQANGYFDLANVLYLKDTRYQFEVKKTGKDVNGNDTHTLVSVGTRSGKVYAEFTQPKDNIDESTEHKIEAKYKYTSISTTFNSSTGKWETGRDCKLTYDKNLSVVFNCWHNANTLAWSTVPSIKWVADPDPNNVINYVDLTTLKVTNSYDNYFFGGDFAKLLNNGWLSDGNNASTSTYPGVTGSVTVPTIVKATLSSGNTSYFDVSVDPYHEFVIGKDANNQDIKVYHTALMFTQKQNTSRPNVHNETLEIVTKDSYGHEVKNTITVQVAPAE